MLFNNKIGETNEKYYFDWFNHIRWHRYEFQCSCCRKFIQTTAASELESKIQVSQLWKEQYQAAQQFL